MALFSTAYLGNIEYYSTILKEGNCTIESKENYIKQSYRTRCSIAATNGVIDLTVPVIKRHGAKQLIEDIEIEYDAPWQKIHLRSIESAYRNSPFYEHYIDFIAPIIERRHQRLFELNSELHNAIMKILSSSITTHYTSEYQKEVEGDYRYTISPKIEAASERFTPYYQVFSEKMAFAPNLSIIDVIFCAGPEAMSIIKATKR